MALESVASISILTKERSSIFVVPGVPKICSKIPRDGWFVATMVTLEIV